MTARFERPLPAGEGHLDELERPLRLAVSAAVTAIGNDYGGVRPGSGVAVA